MKLLKLTGLYFMGFSLVILVLVGVGIFYALGYMLDRELDESLYHTRAVLHRELNKIDSLPPVIEIMDEVIDLKEVAKASDVETYRDTFRLVNEDGEEELEPFRQYRYTDQIKGQYYLIALNHSKFESEHLLSVITLVVTVFLFLFFLVLNLFNRFASQKIWQPFYDTINQVRRFSFSQPEALSTHPSRIEEFTILNKAFVQLTDKLSKDYRSLKRFTENASHEIQTPLAIIRSQIDLLFQREQSEDNLRYLNQIQQSVNKLSKLNTSLLLLSRIENRQFELQEDIEVDEVIKERLASMDILIAGKNLMVENTIVPTTVRANPVLMDIVISNLLSNAIRHNLAKGTIRIVLENRELRIENTGLPAEKPPLELFERFRKSDDAGKTVGLGLAIVKEICHLYGWQITYHNDGEWHVLRLSFE